MSAPRWKSVGSAIEIGLAFPASTVAGYWLGKLADRFFGTEPTLSFVGGFLGVAAAFGNLFRIARAGEGEDDAGPQ